MQIIPKGQPVSTVAPTDVTGQANVKPGHPPTNEQAPKEVTQAPKEDLTPKFTALARQQKHLREQQRAFEQQKREVEAQKAALDSDRKEIESAKAWKQRLQQDPYGVMLETGLTADQVAALLLNQPNPGDQRTQMLEKKISELENAQKSSQDSFKKLQDEQYENAVKQIRNDVTLLVDGNEDFETIKAMNAHDAVVELIQETYTQEGRLMTNEEAAKEVEEYLLDRALELTKLKKLQARLNPNVPNQNEPQTQAQAEASKPIQKQPQINTLSNRMVPSATKPMSEGERRSRAILAFQGKLT